MTENEIGTLVIESALEVHRELGPGLYEIVYETALAYELTQRGLSVERQVAVPLEYKGIRFDEGFRADIIVERRVLLELKSLEQIAKVHHKQVFTYLKLLDLRLGYLLNFGAPLMREGISRIVNQLQESE